jgi:hypothetical protein
MLLKCSGQKIGQVVFLMYISALAVSVYVERQAISGFVDQNMEIFLNNGGLEGGIGSQ